MKKVAHISKMSNEIFLKHMNARHVGAAGISVFGKSHVPGDTDEHLLRMMHKVLHDGTSSSSQKNLDHYHGKEEA